MTDQRFHHTFWLRQPEACAQGPTRRPIGIPARLMASTAILLTIAACNPDLRGSAITRPFNTTQPEVLAEFEPESPTAEEASIPFQQQQFVVAAEGETVRIIAQRLRIDPGKLADFNSVQLDDPLDDGKIVLIPVGAKPKTTGGITEIAESAIAEVESASRQSAPVNPGTHIVAEGETAESIADSYGIEEQELRRANNLPASARLAVGEVLIIPDARTAGLNSEQLAVSAEPEAEIPPPPSQAEPLPEAPVVAELPPSPNLQQFRTSDSQSRFSMPVDGEIIRAYSGKGGNEGIDIAAPMGTAVVAAGDGEVALVSRNSDNTAILLIRHPDDVFTVYANLMDVELKTGTPVAKGQIVGTIAGGDKQFLHFEIRIGTDSTDPVPYLS